MKITLYNSALALPSGKFEFQIAPSLVSAYPSDQHAYLFPRPQIPKDEFLSPYLKPVLMLLFPKATQD